MKYCTRCGKPAPYDAAFCGSCAAAFSSSSTSSPPIEAKRLISIWKPFPDTDEFASFKNGSFGFMAHVGRNAVIKISKDENGDFTAHLRFPRFNAVFLKTGEFVTYPSNAPIRDRGAFETEFLPFFRRNCWLSGCKVEATGHEQIEWEHWLKEQESAPSE